MENTDFYQIVDQAKHTDGVIAGMVNTFNGKKIVAVPKNVLRSICVLGSQNTGKSISFVRNMMIQCVKRNESFIVMDPVAEQYKLMSAYLEEQGYLVFRWDLVDKKCSSYWNPLWEAESEREAEVLCSAIIKNTKGLKSSDDIDESLLKALVLYVTNGPEEQRTMENVYGLLFDKKLDEKLKELSDVHPAKKWYEKLRLDERKTAIVSLKERLKIFVAKAVKEMMQESDLYLESMTEQKIAVFCSTSDENTLLSAIFLNMALEKTKNNKGKPVHFILDEFPNCGYVNFTAYLKNNVCISILANTITQLKGNYDAEQIINACDCIMFLGGSEKSTLEFVSKKGKQVQKEACTFLERLSSSVVSVKSLQAMNPDELLLIIRWQRPRKLEKFYFHKYPKMIKSETLRSRL